MTLQDTIRLCILLLVLDYNGVAASTIYDRPFHLTYANLGGKFLVPSDAEILAAFANMPLRPTMALQVVLNKVGLTKGKEPSEEFVLEFKKLVPNMCFGAGKGKKANNGQGAFLHRQADWDWFMERAVNWRQYTDCISLEAFNVLVENTNETTMIDFLTELNKLGYEHVVANPWVPSESAKPWPFVDAAWIGIRHVDGSKYEAWHPRLARARTITENSPNVKVLMNYENAPGHIALAALGAEGSCTAMQIAVDEQKQYRGSVDFYWAPPWTSNYDPLLMGTWDWIQTTYADLYQYTIVDDDGAAAQAVVAENAELNSGNFRSHEGSGSHKFIYLVAGVSFFCGAIFTLLVVTLRNACMRGYGGKAPSYDTVDANLDSDAEIKNDQAVLL